jgi:hypothetical protein
MTPAALSDELRTGGGAELGRRRGIIALSLLASGAMGAIALYQNGVIKHLPDPPLPYVNSEKVDASAEAYKYLQVGDGALGLGSYAATLTLAAMGPADRASSAPWLPLALGAKLLFDAVYAAKLSVDQWTRHRAFCVYCLTAAGATFASVPLAYPEAREAFERLRRAGRQASMPAWALRSLARSA